MSPDAYGQRELTAADFEKAAELAEEIGAMLKGYDGKADPWHVYLATQILASAFGKALRLTDRSYLRLAMQTFALSTASLAAGKKADLN